MTESENHIASASDFRSAREVDHKVERVVLPQLGKAVLMRRPSPLWFIFRGQLPQSLAVRASGETGGPRAVEDVLRLGRWVSELLAEVMVEPRVSLSPGPDEISPDFLSIEDLNFIIRWAYGEVAADGSDLAAFRGQQPSSASGPGR
ncbi:MAG TPA: hypothetical protein VMX16_02055 [Terriglobia bacterium]|nr:hypothetical protein [Terriglobia bacterium]